MSPIAANKADYVWLAEGPGAKWLENVTLDQPIHQILKQLRRDLPPLRAHLVVEQLQLRHRGRRRFLAADRMYFTDLGLQQATGTAIAKYKATKFDGPVVDLCCGIGGDLMEFSQCTAACGIERDPITAYLANRNLAVVAADSRPFVPQVGCGDAGSTSISPAACLHIDPDRRSTGRRSVTLDLHEPGRDLLSRFAAHPGGAAIKLAPATKADDPMLRDATLEWMGYGRECQQLVAWFGRLSHQPGVRVATVIGQEGSAYTLQASSPKPLRHATSVQRLLIEPHPTVLAAGLSAAVAHEHDLVALTPGGGYLTGPEVPQNPMWSVFEVIDERPFRRKLVLEMLRHHGTRLTEIKQRGADENLADLQRQLSRPSGDPASLFLVKIGQRKVAILARRLGGAS